MDPDVATASLSLTHISYNPDDPISYASAWLSLCPQGLMVAYVTLCWSTREAEILLAFAGQLACEAVNFALKRIIREERPSPQHRGKGYGMPSSHAQFMAFFAVYVGLFLLLRHRPPPRGTAAAATAAAVAGKGKGRGTGSYAVLLPGQYAQQVLTALVLAVNAGLVAASRVYLNYHSPKQVFVGCGVGAAFALFWFVFTAGLRSTGVLGWALDLDVARLFRIKDLLPDEDLVESGWREYEARRERDAVSTVKGSGEKSKKKTK